MREELPGTERLVTEERRRDLPQFINDEIVETEEDSSEEISIREKEEREELGGDELRNGVIDG